MCSRTWQIFNKKKLIHVIFNAHYYDHLSKYLYPTWTCSWDAKKKMWTNYVQTFTDFLKIYCKNLQLGQFGGMNQSPFPSSRTHITQSKKYWYLFGRISGATVLRKIGFFGLLKWGTQETHKSYQDPQHKIKPSRFFKSAIASLFLERLAPGWSCECLCNVLEGGFNQFRPKVKANNTKWIQNKSTSSLILLWTDSLRVLPKGIKGGLK